jgi:aromatic ring hydroxylase
VVVEQSEAAMIRTGEEYRAGLRDGREIWIDGERVADVTEHPAFRPIVAAKARMYDMAHETASAALMSFAEGSEAFSILLRPPTEQEHWHEKWRAVDAYLNDIQGVVTRVGDETVATSSTRSIRASVTTLSGIFAACSKPISFTFPRIPIPRATGRSGRKTRIPT